MTTRALSIIDTAYRGTVEEQDDTVLWLTAMCSGAGLDVSILLSGNAVNYGVRGQDASGLRFGEVTVTHPPRIDEDLQDLIAKGVAVHYVSEDARERGIGEDRLVPGLKPIGRAELPDLFGGFTHVWHW